MKIPMDYYDNTFQSLWKLINISIKKAREKSLAFYVKMTNLY